MVGSSKKVGEKNKHSVFRFLFLVLPAVLFFSYYPVIKLGSGETMEFELSLPLIWLVVFDAVGAFVLVRERGIFCDLKKRWAWLLFPGYLVVSVLWSANMVRGVLTAGILWLLYFAIYVILKTRDVLWARDGFKGEFWKVFFGVAVVVCGWCFLQCVLDLVGVSRECSLMCEGCTYRSFGFPHPNGFAVEPQFMGNLLLAPVLIMAYLMIRDERDKGFWWRRGLLLVVFVATLFLTFSRGAIYAGVIGLIFLSVIIVIKTKKRREIGKKVGVMWVAVAVGFLFTLNLQGIMAEVSPTKDTYFDGISKVLNHLSLGVIDIRKNDEVSEKDYAPRIELTERDLKNNENLSVENSVENFVEKKEESYFDGYVAESTDVRIQMNEVAVELWAKDLKTVMFGVGLGGAGRALYDYGLTGWPKEIVQNQYVSLLLETGLMGMSLLVLTLALIIKNVVILARNMMIKNM